MPRRDQSHFVPSQIVNTLDAQRVGRPYSDAANAAIEKILDQDANTSSTTPGWNRGINKAAENELVRYAMGEIGWPDLSAGAQRRYDEQSAAWQDLREDMKAVAPALTKKADHFYNKGNKQQHS